ncbi:MAG TPA: precorrin-6A reductase [Candidatus Mediterraneibacter norfolkensis]|nr:precorrin-6A reductase [Candidatus Mediterraneibacter norfolkensis]
MISPGILIFAGTTEGRKLAEYASEHDINCYVSTATEYGKSILGNLKGIECISGRMDETEIEDFVKDHDIRLVIDATHPFAVEVTKNIRAACLTADTQYIRCLREGGKKSDVCEDGEEENIVITGSVQEAVEYLRHTQGNILIATGSKELHLYTAIEGYEKRCFARVLSTREAVEESVRLGFKGRNLIAMQGPFSAEMNVALLHQTEATYFVSKESGKAGGFEEKVKAARETGAVLVVVGRPEEEGETLGDVTRMMEHFSAGKKK